LDYKKVIKKMSLLASAYFKPTEIKNNDIVFIKKTFSMATITGVYMSKDYFEVDHDEESYHHRDELILLARGGGKGD